MRFYYKCPNCETSTFFNSNKDDFDINIDGFKFSCKKCKSEYIIFVMPFTHSDKGLTYKEPNPNAIPDISPIVPDILPEEAIGNKSSNILKKDFISKKKIKLTHE